jgi:hypothetical protein
MDRFITHDKKIITGIELQNAFDSVSEDWKKSAYAIYKEDAYAPHVTEEQKKEILEQSLYRAKIIKINPDIIMSFALWQDINQKITGKCIAFLPK